MKIAFVSAMPFRTVGEERIHVYLPFLVAKMRPDWEVHGFYYPSNEEVTVLEEEYGAPVKNYHIHFYKPEDTTPLSIDGMDAIVLWGALPENSIPYNTILRDIEEIRKKCKYLIYYALDNWEGWWNAKWKETPIGNFKIGELEGKIAHLSDFVFAVSPQLCVHISKRYGLERPVHWLPNAANTRRYALPKPNHDKQVCLYLGTLFWARGNGDWDAKLRAAALAYPQVMFYIIGSFAWDNSNMPVRTVQSYHKNLFYIVNKGWYPQVRKICENSTFCLILQGRNPFSYYADPTKWYVYHAMGRPILSLNTPHHAKFPSVYPNTIVHHDLIEGIGKMLDYLERRGNTSAPVNPNHDWQHRAQSFLRILEGSEMEYGRAVAGVWETGRLP